MSARKRNAKDKSAETSGRPRTFPWMAICLAGVVGGLALLAVLPDRSSPSRPRPAEPAPTPRPERPPAPPTGPVATKESLTGLVGRWIRTDGGYVLKIKQVQEDGKLDALYLNPMSIHIAQATARLEQSRTKVFIELQDTGYPGCTYELDWDPVRDRLVGSYFQAAMSQTFDVEFVREE